MGESGEFPWGPVLAIGSVAVAGVVAYNVGKTDGAAPYVDDHTPAASEPEVLRRLRKKATDGCVHPDVRKLGGELRDKVHARRGTRLDELFDLFFWVRDNVKWHDDPAQRPDYFAPAHETIQSKRGDCDDQAVLMAALAQANNFETRFLLIPQHVITCVVLDEVVLAELVRRFPITKQLVRRCEVTGRKLLPLEVVAKTATPGQLMRFTEEQLAKAPHLLER